VLVLPKLLIKIRFGLTLIKYTEKFGSPFYLEIWKNLNFNMKNYDKTNLSYQKDHPDNQDHIIRPQLELPSYKEHLTTDPNIIKIFIFYTFDNGYSIPKELDRISLKRWRPNNFHFDKKIISVKASQNATLEDLKKYISDKTGHNSIAIKLHRHPTWKKILDAKNKVESNYKLNKLNNDLINNFNSKGISTFASNYLDISPDPLIEKTRLENIILKAGDNTFKFYIGILEEMTHNGYC
jgi:hypothetical protein